jgi:hypothetical protein
MIDNSIITPYNRKTLMGSSHPDSGVSQPSSRKEIFRLSEIKGKTIADNAMVLFFVKEI